MQVRQASRLVLFAFLAALITGGCSANQAAVSSGPEVQDEASEIAGWQSNHGPSALQIYGNPEKWKGAFTKISCKIQNVITTEDGTGAANAVCGEGVNLSANYSMPNVDYTDPNAVAKAEQKQAREMNEWTRKAQDQSLILLVGDKVKALDGGQVVTIVGPVLGTLEGKNTMGVTTQFPTVRVDYVEPIHG